MAGSYLEPRCLHPVAKRFHKRASTSCWIIIAGGELFGALGWSEQGEDLADRVPQRVDRSFGLGAE